MIWTQRAMLAVALAVCMAMPAGAQEGGMLTRDFEFRSGGNMLSGVIDTPASGEADALVIFIHGYGPSDIRERDSYRGLRERFVELGLATVTWDKPGQGRSQGVFDINQPVEESAREVLDAIAHLRAANEPGADRIGLWGISRAGWIAPLAMEEDPGIEFWISVSGTTAEDNFFYLLMSNLLHEGASVAEVEILRQEWIGGYQVFRSGGSLETFESVTPTLRANTYIRSMGGDWWNRIDYASAQADLMAAGDEARFHPEAGQYIFVPGFEALLRRLDVDVLALFGDKDLNIDWRAVRDLYESTLGENPDASLQIHVFEDADHNLNRTQTGSLQEMTSARGVPVEAYYDIQLEWLRRTVLRGDRGRPAAATPAE